MSSEEAQRHLPLQFSLQTNQGKVMDNVMRFRFYAWLQLKERIVYAALQINKCRVIGKVLLDGYMELNRPN